MRPGVPITMSTPRRRAPTWRCLRNAAVHLGGEESDAARDGLHGAVDLERELTGRREDEGARGAAHLALHAAGRLGEQALHQRSAEGDGLARAGAAAAEHVAAGEHVRDGGGLDRERLRSRRAR